MSVGATDARVDVVIGGVQKGGTTALDGALRSHPAMRMPREKEPHWFDIDANFGREPRPLAEYHALWGGQLASGLCCDSTPTYLWWPRAAQRIAEYNPAMRWIVLLRDPAERAYSHWNMQRMRGNDTLSFADALKAEPERLRSGSPEAVRRHSYASRGYYGRQLANLFACFPRDQVLALRSDRLRGDFAASIGAVLDFLGLEPATRVHDVVLHEGDYSEPLSPADRAWLVERYDADLRETERLLGWDLSDWRRA